MFLLDANKLRKVSKNFTYTGTSGEDSQLPKKVFCSIRGPLPTRNKQSAELSQEKGSRPMKKRESTNLPIKNEWTRPPIMAQKQLSQESNSRQRSTKVKIMSRQ